MAAPWPLPGSLSFEGEDPVFTFAAPAGAVTRQLFENMFVEFDVRPDGAGTLAYHLGLPDRGLPTSSIALSPEETRRAERGAGRMNVCPTFVTFVEGERLDLSEFVVDVAHDWSGAYGRAWIHFSRGEFAQAAAALGPLVVSAGPALQPLRLYGRCLRETTSPAAAIEQYRRALPLAVSAAADTLLPSSSGVLNDMGVAYKRQGDAVRAEICLLHALHLRPNYPQALLTLAATLLDRHLVLHAAARVLAIGGHDHLVSSLLGSVAEVTGTRVDDWRDRADRCITAVDLRTWPLDRRGLGTLSALARDLDRGEMTFGPTPAEALVDLPATPP